MSHPQHADESFERILWKIRMSGPLVAGNSGRSLSSGHPKLASLWGLVLPGVAWGSYSPPDSAPHLTTPYIPQHSGPNSRHQQTLSKSFFLRNAHTRDTPPRPPAGRQRRGMAASLVRQPRTQEGPKAAVLGNFLSFFLKTFFF